MGYVLSPLYNAVPVIDANGDPISGGKIYTYLAGTSTPTTTWKDNAGVTAHTNPIILDSRGYSPSAIWLDSATSYKFAVTTAADVPVGTALDNIKGVIPGSAPAFPASTNLSMGGYRLTNLSAPASGTDAVHRDYGDARWLLPSGSGSALTGISTSQISLTVAATITGNTTIDSTYNGKFIVVDSASSVTLTLADANPAGFRCLVLRKGAGAVSIQRETAGLINGSVSAKSITAQWNLAHVYTYVSGGTSITLST